MHLYKIFIICAKYNYIIVLNDFLTSDNKKVTI